jgi:LemA protein
MFWLILLIVVVVLVALYGLYLYNSLISKRNRVENAWSQIDVQLKRRLDLIPNLVETVKGYAAHERATLDAVVQARNAAMTASGPAAQAQADNQITGALRQLFALSEAYPDLKANQNFLELQEELSATEGRVAYARQFYNDSVLSYNTGIQKFPAALLAKRMGFRPREYFEAEEGARQAPRVEF